MKKAIRDQGYVYFLSEAPELLQTVEDGLLKVHEGNRVQNVHSLMRAAHTLKGAAANVGLDSLKTIAHSMEDAFKALYDESIAIDTELERLLFEGYECLRVRLRAELSDTEIDEDALLDRAADVFARMKDKLGDAFGQQDYVPTSAELGFDIARSIFELGVQQRLEELETALDTGERDRVEEVLRSSAEVFSGLGESLSLPGWSAIATTVLAALNNPDRADRILDIGAAALADYRRGQQEVLGGDLDTGGVPTQLNALLNENSVPVEPASATVEPPAIETALDIELEQFRAFLNNKRYGKPVKGALQEFFIDAIRAFAKWFARENAVPLANVCFELIVPKLPAKRANHKATVVRTASNIKKQSDRFLEFIAEDSDSESLCLYRQWTLFSVIVAVAKFQYASDTQKPKTYDDVLLVKALRRISNHIGQQYNQLPPVRRSERNWLESPHLAKLDVPLDRDPDEDLLEQVWGSDDEVETEETNDTEATEETSPNLSERESLPAANEEKGIAPNREPPVESLQEQVSEGEFFDEDPPPSPEEEAAPKRPKAETRQLVSVDIKGLERLNHRLGELLVDRNRQALEEEHLQQRTGEMRSYLQQHQKTMNQLLEWSERMVSTLGHAADNFQSRSSLALPLSSPFVGDRELEFDSFADLHLLLKTAVGEARILDTLTEDVRSHTRELAQLMEKQQQLLSVMQDDLVDVRMLPLGEILQRFPLMVQQLSRMQNKRVELKLSGTDLLVEQSIAQKLYDPLLHLVRNAFDHGLESPEERLKLGKPEVGTIEIRAYNQGVQTTIEVRDDGRGLNLDWIRRKAVEGKFLSEAEANRIVSTDRLEVLFEPGFSTADRVSEISGRGVGLDVVRSQIQSLKGKIAVESEPGRGTVFALQIPLSLTIAKLLVVQAGGSAYALLLDSVEKIVMPPPDRLKHFENHKVLHLEGEGETSSMVSVRQLADLMHYSSSLAKPTEEPRQTKLSISRDISAPILLLRQGGKQLGLEVDRILGEQELVIRPLGRAIAPPPYVYGCSILSDSRLALVVDGGAFATPERTSFAERSSSGMSFGGSSERPLPAQPTNSLPQASAVSEVPATPPTTLLIVDDSINLRHTLTSTLVKAGYQVVQARDGQEAIEQLQQHPDVRLVVCDVEMPRMNGFEFLSYCRQDSHLSKVPIVMLTSHSSPKYRQIASELGATAYLTKPFSESEMLSSLKEIVGSEAEGRPEV
ncbi:hybrid sensor histidine kinase/response regulator [Baaleninema simplex]|uniref:hybrid sensor histidine kinase/response regulator n=1 Tax=Baaleninema simplex TaxID=2862350 RepID=UPI000348638A|nr:hybrid sensor histidine kinase/response regulator [Baaleninema simplex]